MTLNLRCFSGLSIVRRSLPDVPVPVVLPGAKRSVAVDIPNGKSNLTFFIAKWQKNQ